MSSRGGIGYSKMQTETHNIIKSLHANGMGYRKIANHLNLKNIKTYADKQWKGNHVYATLKRFKDREKRLSLRDKEYKPEKLKNNVNLLNLCNNNLYII